MNDDRQNPAGENQSAEPGLGDGGPAVASQQGVGRRGRKSQKPGDQIPENGAQQSAQHHAGIHYHGVDQPLAQGLGNRRSHHECRHEVEERRPHHRYSRAQHPGRDYGSDRVGTVVEAVDEIEDQRDADDDQDIEDVVIHAQPCLIEMDSSTFPASSMWSSVFSSVS